MHCRHFSQCRFGDENTKPETPGISTLHKTSTANVCLFVRLNSPLQCASHNLIPCRSNGLCGVTQYQNDGISSEEHLPNLSASLHLLRPAGPGIYHQGGLDVRDESVLVYWFLPFSFWCLYPHLLNEQADKASEGVERGDEIEGPAFS